MFDIINWLNDNMEWLFSGIGVTVIMVVCGISYSIFRWIFDWIRPKKKVEPKQTQITGDNCVNFQVGDSLTINDSHFGGKENVK